MHIVFMYLFYHVQLIKGIIGWLFIADLIGQLI